MPALLGELHAVIPSYSNQFFWAGPNQELANMYDEGDVILPVMPLYLSEFHNKRERDAVFTFAETMRRSRNSEAFHYRESTLKVDERAFKKHDYYNLVVRPTGIDDVLQLKVSERSRSLGLLHLTRQIGEPAFTARDRRVLERIAPFAAHAFGAGCNDQRLAESDDHGLVIATPAGKIKYLSPQAGRLIVMAQHPVLLSAACLPGPGAELPTEVVRL
ncbi:MAG: hypothetical protein ACREDD_13395, partial [Methylocella sp.]